jgi:serine/threonine protein kinase
MSLVTHPMRSTVGPHRVVARLGEGRIGDVYLIQVHGRPKDDDLAVVKQLRTELLESSEFVETLVHRVQLASRLDHPNIVQTYGVSKDDGRLYVAMEYVDGQSWYRARARLWADGQLRLHVHLKVLADILAGLQCAHEMQLMHCGINPQNVFLTYEGQVKIADFGAAAALLTAPGAAAENSATTLCYLAPEQVHGNAVDGRADLFSVGVMLWEALARRPLVYSDRPEQMPIEEQGLNLAPALVAMCGRALASNPADRFATAAEFRAAILRHLAKSPGPSDPREAGSLMMNAFRGEHEQIHSAVACEVEASAPLALTRAPVPPPPLPPLPFAPPLPPPIPTGDAFGTAPPKVQLGASTGELDSVAAAAAPTNLDLEPSLASLASSDSTRAPAPLFSTSVSSRIGAVLKRAKRRDFVLGGLAGAALLAITWFQGAASPHPNAGAKRSSASRAASGVESPRALTLPPSPQFEIGAPATAQSLHDSPIGSPAVGSAHTRRLDVAQAAEERRSRAAAADTARPERRLDARLVRPPLKLRQIYDKDPY